MNNMDKGNFNMITNEIQEDLTIMNPTKEVSTEDEYKNPYEDAEIIEEAKDFLRESSRYFSDDMQRARSDLKFYSNKYWDEETRKEFKRKRRLCSESNEYKKITAAICSSYTKSPYHIALIDAPEEVQEVINRIEFDSGTKQANLDNVKNACITGYGYGVITSVKDEYTDSYKWIIESVPDISMVAADPTATKSTLEDAEQGAIISYLPIKKAKRLYGEDIISEDIKYGTPLCWDLRRSMVCTR